MLNQAEQKQIGMRSLMGYKGYGWLMGAKIISSFGDSIDSIAFGWMVYVLTNSKMLMGSLFAVNFIPNIVFSVFAGVVADQVSKKKLVVIGDLGRGAVVALTALLFLTHRLETWHLFVFTFINSTFESFSNPARSAMIRFILPKELLLPANSIATSAVSFASLLGLGAAGFIIATLGISGAIFIDAATFFASAMLIGMISLKEQKTAEKVKFTIKGYFDNLKEGFLYVKKESIIIVTICLAAFVNFCLVPFNVLRPVYSDEILRAGAKGVSYLGVGITLGMAVGGILMAQFSSRFKKVNLMVGGFVSFGLCYGLLGLPGILVLSDQIALVTAVVICFFWGLSIPCATAPLATLVQSNTPEHLMGRVSAFHGMICLSAIPFGAMLTGIVSEYIKLPILFLAMGICVMLASLMLLMNEELRNA